MQTQEPQLRGKVAIVTGAGRGIGRAIALAYARQGAAVCCAARSLGQVQETAAQIAAEGGRALAVATDVTDFASVERMVGEAEQAFGGLDIVVMNAGVGGGQQTVEASDPQTWRATIEVNLMGAYHCAKAALPALKRRGAGKIIAIGSGHGQRGRAGVSDYACSKAGLWMLTRVLAQELAPHNISVNQLIPGPVVTEMTGDLLARNTFEGEWVKSPEDVAPLAVFLAAQPEPGPTAQSFSLMRRDA
ncbi:SDR family NAD(P)-dependent oxidoreductase [Paraburkholderia silviterrae]|uniref:SDR family oxidoreductase n=1 Tax=Paraburkholderia silviterrae TaxID=2528715 RepID=A0A4R5LYT5_9BURK|nr:SDR family oxidoreductase [Paraburkholderia silviterrae]TDG17531.1 SDR family oxidoreductase [Paraburkholderia silviterrae]